MKVITALTVLLLSSGITYGALSVTRHRMITPENDYIGLVIGNVAPTTTAIQVEPINGAWTWGMTLNEEWNHNLLHLSTNIWFVGLQAYGNNTYLPLWRVRECVPGPNNTATCGEWNNEVYLVCFGVVVNGGCDPQFYHSE